MKTDNNLIDRAYHLWEQADPKEQRNVTQVKIVHQLSEEMRAKNPKDIRLSAFFNFFYTAWVKSKVKTALSAYKFDLLSSNKEKCHLGLFKTKERWFFEQKLTKILKNIIIKRPVSTLEEKASRWEAKVNKFYNAPELMLGSYFLHQLKTVSPKLKNIIQCIEALPLEPICKRIIEELDDDEVMKGVKKYLEKPFNPQKKPKTIFSEIAFYTAQENAKLVAKNLYQGTRQTISDAYSSIGKKL